MTAPTPRPATASDADDLTRLHVEGGLGHLVNDGWRDTHRADLACRLQAADPNLVAFVVEPRGGAGIVSAAVGFLQTTLCRPSNPTGRSAHLASVTTLPGFRRRGFAAAVTTAFITEVAARGCPAVTLTATETGMNLYRALGFTPHTHAMRLDLTPPAARRRCPPQPYAQEQ